MEKARIQTIFLTSTCNSHYYYFIKSASKEHYFLFTDLGKIGRGKPHLQPFLFPLHPPYFATDSFSFKLFAIGYLLVDTNIFWFLYVL